MRLAKAPPRPRKTGRAAARAIGQSAFRERPQDLLLDRVARDEAADHHEPSLSDAAGAVRCLVLDGRVSPRVEVDDEVRGREVEARSACLELLDEAHA